MIVTGKELLSKAKAGKYAVPALNVDNLESVIGVLRAAEERTPSSRRDDMTVMCIRLLRARAP